MNKFGKEYAITIPVKHLINREEQLYSDRLVGG